MGQFKPMVKMETTEPSIELKLKKGGSVKKAMGGMMGAPMGSAMPARGGMMPVARPKRPTMAARRAAMLGMKGMQGGMKDGGKAETSKMKSLEKDLKSHESKSASKGHKGLKSGGMACATGGMMGGGGMHMMPDGKMMKDSAMKKGGKACATGGVLKSAKPGNFATGGVVNGQGGYKKGGMASGGKMPMKDGKPAFLASKMAMGGVAKSGIMNTEGQGGAYRNTKMDSAMPDNNSAPTGSVKMGNAGGYKKGGATKKHYATGGAVNNSGRAVAMPSKKPSAPVSNDRQSGTFKTGGSVTTAQKKEQSNFKSENKTAMKQAKAQSNLKYQAGGAATTDLSKGAYDKSIGPSESDMDMAKAIRSVPRKLYEGAKSLFTSKEKPSGSVTKTEKSVTVTPAKKRGGAVNC